MSDNIHKRPKGAARILTAVVAGVLALSLAGCAAFDSWVGDVKGELTGNAFTMKAYSNTGELTMTAHGRRPGRRRVSPTAPTMTAEKSGSASSDCTTAVA